MATVSRDLPERPHLDVPKREARELLADWRVAKPEALERIRARHPKFKELADASLAGAVFKLADAQLVLAREYGLPTWAALKARIAAAGTAGALLEAIQTDDRDAVVALLRAHPEMLHLPVRSANWGPPMSHAANLGHLELIRAIDALGARDHQHAFDRALLQGKIECARWLHARGAKLAPGIIMGSCETLNVDGFRFLLERGAPLTDEHGDRLAPLNLVLGTYCRNPAGKHAILALFAAQGYMLPDTPMLAFHRGDLARLEQFRRDDPRLLARQFTRAEIYPAACGCPLEGPSGMHWTPIEGTTLLHLAIDFREREIFDWLIAHGADVNARAAVDAAGFGGHTPLFHTVVNGPQRDDSYAVALLAHGADRTARASLRKFLDWREDPFWHEAKNVTPAEWAETFPDQGWVNRMARMALDVVKRG